MLSGICAMVLVFAAPLAPDDAKASATISHNTKIQLYFVGIPVGKLKFYFDLKDGGFELLGTARTTGIVRIISDTKGTVRSQGFFNEDKLQVTTHSLDYKEDDEAGALTMDFANGDLKQVKATPKIDYAEGAIPVKPSDLQSIVDPASAAFAAVKSEQIDNGAAICNRTMPIFDGKFRFNIRSQFKGTRKIDVRGFEGKGFVCSLRYEPVAGHRPFKKNIQYMQANEDIEIVMARIGNTNVYGLIQFAVRTFAGKVTGKAYKFLTEVK